MAVSERGPLRYVRVDDGVEICFQTIPAKNANAPVIIFMHGYTSYRGTWFNVIKHLVGKYHCVLLDMRGCGLSSKPTTEASYSISRFAEDVIAVADAVKAKDFIYVGHSLGGAIGFHLATSAHASRLTSLVLVAPVASTGVFDPNNLHANDVHRRAQFTLSMYDGYRRALSTRPEHAQENEEEWVTSLVFDLGVPRAYYDATWRAMVEFRVKPETITTPTLMITADSDNLLSSNYKDFRAIPKASLHVFSRVSHSIPREVPQPLASVIDDFIVNGVVSLQTLLARASVFDAVIKPKL